VTDAFDERIHRFSAGKMSIMSNHNITNESSYQTKTSRFTRGSVSVPETGNHSLTRFGIIIELRMTINKKQLVGITAVVLTVAYSLLRWRSDPPELNDSEFDTEQVSPGTE